MKIINTVIQYYYMFSGSDKLSIDQRQLISTLNDALVNYNNLQNHNQKTLKVDYRTGLGSISDNFKMIKQYVCSCGSSTKRISHSTTSQAGGKLLDSYHINCKNCGDEEKINFHMLKEALKAEKKVPTLSIRKSLLYPYL